MDTKLEIVLSARDVTGAAFKKVQGRLKSLTKSVFSFQTVMVGAAGVAGIGYFVKKNLEAADSIAKIADSVGVSTKSLQEYRFMAERSGVATAQLDQGLGAFSKRLGELKAGTGALSTYLKKNNEALQDQLVATTSTDEALGIFLSSLAKIENQSEKTALSAAAFSRTAGIKMTNMVKGGTKSLAGMRKEFADLGLEINEKWLRQSEKAVDQFTNLEYAIKSRLMGAVVQAAPQITNIVGKMTDWVTSNDDFLEQKIPGYVDSIGDSIAGMGTSVKNFVNSKEFDAIKEYWEIVAGAYIGSKLGPLGALFGAGAGGFYSAYKDLTKDKQSALQKLQDEYKSLGLVIAEVNRLEESGAILNPMKRSLPSLQAKRIELEKQMQAIINPANSNKSLTGSPGNSGFSKKEKTFFPPIEPVLDFEENYKKFLPFDKIAQEQSRLVDDLMKQEQERAEAVAETFKNMYANLPEMEQQFRLDSIEGDLDSFFSGLEEIEDELKEKVNNPIQEYAESFGTMTESIQHGIVNSFQTMEDSLVDFVMTGKFEFKSFASSVLEDMSRIMIQQSIMKPFSNWVAGMSFGGGGGGSFDPFSLISFDTGGQMGSDGKKKPFPAIIHEDEIVGSPRQLAQLYGGKDNKSGGSGGGETIINNHYHITNNIQTMDSKSFNQFMQENPGPTVSIVGGALKGNTGLRKLMRGTI